LPSLRQPKNEDGGFIHSCSDGMPSLMVARMTPAQCRAARALLNWSQQELAERANMSVTALRNFERGASDMMRNNLAAIRAVLQAEGIELLDGEEGEGVRRRQAPGVVTDRAA
jgi:transcriptional regulator with XRE-family HTH domain